MISGESGTGKSVALRIVAGRLAAIRNVIVGVLQRPQSKPPDFYRELGDIFSVNLSPWNRWGGFKALRDRWRARRRLHADQARALGGRGPGDDAQVLGELRILASADFDARSLLTVVLCGDARLQDHLRQPDLVPLGTRIRARLHLEAAPRDELGELLRHALSTAGNATLMTPELQDALVDHAAGNYRLLMNMAGELLAHGLLQDRANWTRSCTWRSSSRTSRVRRRRRRRKRGSDDVQKCRPTASGGADRRGFLPGPAPAMAGGSVVGGLVGRRDRRRPMPQDLVGPRPRVSVATGTRAWASTPSLSRGRSWPTWPRTPCRSSASALRASAAPRAGFGSSRDPCDHRPHAAVGS